MDVINQDELKALINMTDQWCVSLYMPTHPVGRDQQDQIRFKNLLNRAQQELLALEVDRMEVEKILQPAQTLRRDPAFWQNQGDGLAVFLAADFSNTYRVPIQFPEILAVSQAFHIKPLLPLVRRDERFYILVIGLNAIRLYEATKDIIERVPLENIPANMQEALWMDDPERHSGFHTSASSPGRTGLRRAVFYGQGGKPEARKTNILRYFHYADEGLNKILKDQHYPMILAGIEYLLPIYQQANTYAGLLTEGLGGNPDQVDEKELRQLSWEVVEPLFKEDQQQAIQRFAQYDGQQNGLASSDLKTVLQAAYTGRVQVLFVALHSQEWGQYDASKRALEQHSTFQPGDRDLLDLAAAQTLLKGGPVYAMEPEHMPGNALIAAIFRY